MKHIYIFLSYIFFSFFTLSNAQAYSVYPSCPDFTNITASYTEAFYGKTSNPFLSSGIVSTRHQVITTQGTDPNTGGGLSFLPPGESRVVKLGNQQVNAEAEALTYHFIVDANNPVLLVKFAVVFQDPSHTKVQQPRFIMRISDKNGNLIEDCSLYDVSSATNIDGFQTYTPRTGVPVHWRNWTNVGLDMTSFIGQEVQVQFITYDCTLGAHYGYAYFTASCIPNKLALAQCDGTTFTVQAPDNFVSYLWDNGNTTRTTTRNITGGNMNLWCLITSATGCQFKLTATATAMLPSETDIKDTICQGASYPNQYFDLPVQNEPGTFSYYNTFLDLRNCTSNLTATLTLTVKRKFYPIDVSICEGASYVDKGFNIQNPAVGVYRDTLWYKSKVTGCDSILCLNLTVNEALKMPVVTGNTSPCAYEPSVYSYSFSGANNMISFSWVVPSNAVIVSGANTSQISVYFTNNTPGNVVLKGQSGCGISTVSLAVKPRATYNIQLTDSVCTGQTYNKYGFNLGIQNTVGLQVLEKNEQTKLGCDSTVILSLYTYETPTVKIVASDSILCSPKQITLYVVDNGGGTVIVTPPKIAVGDIYCTDESIVKPSDLKSSGKTAAGIVSYVDNTGEHGWAVALKNAATTAVAWSAISQAGWRQDIPGLTNYTANDQALTDLNGYTNTQTIRSMLFSSYIYPAASSVNFPQKWYLPSIGQLRLMLGLKDIINSSLALVGGNAVANASYWSSTEASSDNAWMLLSTGEIAQIIKTNNAYVRAMINF